MVPQEPDHFRVVRWRSVLQVFQTEPRFTRVWTPVDNITSLDESDSSVGLRVRVPLTTIAALTDARFIKDLVQPDERPMHIADTDDSPRRPRFTVTTQPLPSAAARESRERLSRLR